jgi:DNA polymerase-3 subunit alpha
VKEYAGLHCHSHFSQMDGVAKPSEYAQRAVEIGMTSLAMTDHGTLSGHREWVREMRAVGVKPILGVEAYFTKDRFDTRDKSERTDPLDVVYNHLVILAKNDQGLENLGRLNEIAWTEGFYKKPRMDYEILDKYGDGLIITSGCMSGLLNKAIENDNLAAAKKEIQWFADRFGDDFYVEVMPHNVAGMNAQLLDLADSMGIKSVVTPDCHHSSKDQKIIQEAMLLLNTHAKLRKEAEFKKSQKIEDMMERFDYLYGDDRMMTFRHFDIHLLSGDEMWEAMAKDGVEREDIFTNTLAIADSVEEYDIKENLNLLPAQYRDPDAQLEKLSLAGLKSRGLETQEYMDRLNEELQIIKDKDFAPYFIVVKNMLGWAKKQGIMVGPGRGSSAGSLICYALGITDVDPLEHGLLFFRFIDPSRDDWPDIDSDIQDTRREEVKDYLVRQYRHVASIATFLQFKDKGVVRDVARVLNVPLPDVNKALKYVDTWDEFVRSPQTLDFRTRYPEVVEIAEQLRGRIRGTGIHAAGVVTAKEPISKIAPMETRNVPGQKERMPVVAVDMEEAARIGLIKIDALGLKTLSVISDTLKTIESRHPKPIKTEDIPMDDRHVYRMLSDGHTQGVFQCEATPYTNLLIKMGVENFSDLAASNALVRPGAMNTIGKEYISRKRGNAVTSYIHPIMKKYTEETYGEIIYQEQVMLACVELGGMTMAEANKVRKIIGKKKDVKEFEAYKNKFVSGASKHIGQEDAEHLWKDFEAHAGYSFNKSHAVAYSTLSYWTAWLKYHYPLEFMYALLKNEGDKDKRTEYLIEAKRLKIPLRLPHINESDNDFKIEGDGIRFGLSAVKFISDKIALRYVEERPFKSLKEVEEFTYTKGSGVNSRALSAMNAVGALAFPDNPVVQEEVRANLYEYLNLPEFTYDVPAQYHAYVTEAVDYEEKGAFILLGLVRNIKRGKGWSRVELLDKSGTVGMFDKEQTNIETGKTYLILVGDNRIIEAIPADSLKGNKSGLVKFMNYKTMPFSDDEYFVVAFKKRVTKTNKNMATMVLANSDRELASVVVFPTQFGEAFIKLTPGEYYKISLGQARDGGIVFKGVA